MKKISMMFAMAAMVFSLAGCSKASKFESLLREGYEIMEQKVDEADIKKEVERFEKLSEEEQTKALKDAEEGIKTMKEMKKALKN